MKFEKTLSFAIILFIPFSLYASPNDSIKRSFLLGSKLHYGIILPHSEQIRELAYNKPYGAEFNYSWLNASQKAINQCNCYSRTGLGLSYINFGNPKIGSSVNLSFYFEPLIRHQKNLYFTVRAGTGISYLSTVYNEQSNPQNKFFSMHFSFLLLVEFNAKFKLSDHLKLTSSLCYNHISNGGIKQPNYGMNFPTFTLGIDYSFKPTELTPIRKEKIKAKEKILKFKIEALASIKVQNKTDEFEEKACFAYGLSAFLNKRITKFSALSAGIEYISDVYVKEEIRRTGLNRDHRRASVICGHDLVLGRTNLTLNFGYYFYSPFKAKSPFYQKYMLQFKFSKKIYSGIYMLAHGDAAGLMGFNIGYIF